MRLLRAIVASSLLAGCTPAPSDNALRVSGHVEATEVQVSAEVGGRIIDLQVDDPSAHFSGHLHFRG